MNECAVATGSGSQSVLHDLCVKVGGLLTLLEELIGIPFLLAGRIVLCAM